MRKRIALATASAITFAMMVGPGALTVAAEDSDTDVRAETGWMMHDKDFKGRGNAFGHLKRSEERGPEGIDRRGRDSLFGTLKDADLNATQTAEVRTAIQVKQDSILTAMKSRMAAQIEAMETRNAAVLDAWTIEDKDARNAALEEVHVAVKENRVEIHTTFRASVKIALDTFTSTIKSILGL